MVRQRLTCPGPPGAAGASATTGYKIEYSKNNMLPWMDVGTTTVTTNDDGTKYSDKGLASGTTRHYRVSAMNIAGRGPVSATDANGAPHMAMTTLAGVPAAPTRLTATAVGTITVELSWTAPNEGRAPITGYQIEHSIDNGGTWDNTTPTGVPNTEGSGADNMAASGVQTYYSVTATAEEKNLYRVSAMNIIGVGPVSDSASATLPVDGQEPGAPTLVMTRADGSAEIEVTWTAPTAIGASPITGYKIEYSKDNMLPWMEVATTTTTTAMYSDTGLDPDTTRYYRVSAINVVGRGPVSDTAATATTDDAAADQMGTVTLSTQEPMVGTAITATLTDADGMISGQMWQWQKSMDMSAWMAATGAGAMTRSYTPAAGGRGLLPAGDGYVHR